MINEAERFKRFDELQSGTMDARHMLESFAFNIKEILHDDSIANNISETDHSKVSRKTEEIIRWLQDHPSANINECKRLQVELEEIAGPIMAKMYGTGEISVAFSLYN